MRIPCLVASAVIACAKPLPPTIPGGATEPLAMREGYLFVHAGVDGQPARFVVDTGASISALTERGAARLGVTRTGAELVNGHLVGTGTVRSFSVAGLEHANVRVAIVDLPAARHLGARIDGILGLDVLARSDVVIDLARKTLHLHSAGALARSAPDMARVPFRSTGRGLIVFDVRLRDRAMPALLDLGSPITYVNELTAPQRHLVRASRIEIADTTLYGTSHFLLVENLAAFVNEELAGSPVMLLGTDFFHGRVLAISFRERVAFISR
jgi:hypothetical protein